ncbi:hypothetical protein BCON_0084g00360 [Botryotinia convoluta]|uniref:Uncharacterized protein n=1 Tax=Botryotinia convoluta TaxID=54673 RepID=A0A4Z1I2P7_9HELO|nr:hypothetical protein BCON_0084g00360 [Botryotinia convoluta]
MGYLISGDFPSLRMGVHDLHARLVQHRHITVTFLPLVILYNAELYHRTLPQNFTTTLPQNLITGHLTMGNFI